MNSYTENEAMPDYLYLIEYVEALLIRMKNGNITEDEKRLVTEMIIKSKLSDEFENNKDFTDDDFIKFLSMGWYVYNMLDKKTPV